MSIFCLCFNKIKMLFSLNACRLCNFGHGVLFVVRFLTTIVIELFKLSYFLSWQAAGYSFLGTRQSCQCFQILRLDD